MDNQLRGECPSCMRIKDLKFNNIAGGHYCDGCSGFEEMTLTQTLEEFKHGTENKGPAK